MQDRKKNVPHQASDALREIYQSPGGKEPDLTHFDRKPRRRRHRLLLVLGILFLFAALAVAGFFVFTRQPKFSGASVKIVIDGPQQAASGDDLVWTVRLVNSGSVGLEKPQLNLRYASGFQYLSSQPAPANTFDNSWALGTVKPGGERSVKLVGRLIGDVGTTKTLFATASYQPANFSSDFTVEGSLDTLLSNSTLDIDIKAPPNVTSGQNLSYTVTLKNTSDRPLERIRLEATYPEGLTEITTEPKATEGDRTWGQEKLDGGKELTVTIKGTLAGSPNTLTELKVRAGILDQDSAFRVQRERSALVLLLEPKLNVTVSVDGKTTNTATSAGSTIKAVVQYSNDSDTAFSDLNLALTYDGTDADGGAAQLIDEGGLAASVPFVHTDGKAELHWTKNELKDLERLVPGSKGTINVTLPLKKNLRSIGSGKNLSLGLVGTVHAAQIGGTTSPYDGKTDPLVVKVDTELRLAVEARYFSDEGVQLGVGPLPPQVGSETRYRLSWFVTNTLNGANSVLLKAKVPDNAIYIDASTSGGNNISYDTTTREVLWRIQKIDAGVGQTLPTLQGDITIAVAPKEGDIGAFLPLLGATTLTATDAFSGSALSVNAGAVTTDLRFDPLAAEKGKVIAAPAVTNTNSTTSP